jgi:GT2 family glycosyltransferase
MSLSVGVAILNWNGVEWLKAFLGNVVENSKNQAKVYVIDNASTDDSVQYIAKYFPEVVVLQNKFNSGYTGGYNFGMTLLEEEIVILLNSDVEVTPYWLDPIVREFNLDSNLDALQPRILNQRSKSQFEYAGAAGGFLDSWGYPFCRGRIFQHLEEDHGQYNDKCNVFWASGACLAVRRNAYLEIGGLDPLFFAHFEEIDLCWRIQRRGGKILYCPDSTVYHVGGGTLSNLNPKKTFYNFRNNLFVLFKNLPRNPLFVAIFLRLILDGMAGALFLIQGKPKHTMAVIKAHFSFYKHFNQLRERRKELKHLPALWPLKGVYQKSLVLDYFLLGKRKFEDLDQQKFT